MPIPDDPIPDDPTPDDPGPAHVQQPRFAAAVRGYDRAQVDDYLGRIHQWLAEAESRTVAAEQATATAAGEVQRLRQRVDTLKKDSSTSPPRSMTALGERVGEILQASVDAAEELRVQAEEEARSVRAAATGT